MVQALAFGELLFGGLLLASAIKNIPLSELLTHGLKGLQAPSSAGTTTETGAAAGGAPSGNTEGAPLAGGMAAPSPGAAAGAVLKSTEDNLSKYLKRPLTNKEKSELRSLQGKGEL